MNGLIAVGGSSKTALRVLMDRWRQGVINRDTGEKGGMGRWMEDREMYGEATCDLWRKMYGLKG